MCDFKFLRLYQQLYIGTRNHSVVCKEDSRIQSTFNPGNLSDDEHCVGDCMNVQIDADNSNGIIRINIK